MVRGQNALLSQSEDLSFSLQNLCEKARCGDMLIIPGLRKRGLGDWITKPGRQAPGSGRDPVSNIKVKSD